MRMNILLGAHEHSGESSRVAWQGSSFGPASHSWHWDSAHDVFAVLVDKTGKRQRRMVLSVQVVLLDIVPVSRLSMPNGYPLQVS